MQYPSRDMGVMTDEEFCEAADHILQLPNERLRKTLFSETVLQLQTTQAVVLHVHASKLACKCLYLSWGVWFFCSLSPTPPAKKMQS